MNVTSDIVQKLWSLCHVLRDDGISYLQYVTELTYLLFLKMMQETGAEATQLPEGQRWDDLTSRDGLEQLNFYRAMLLALGQDTSRRRVQAIFANAQTAIKQPRILSKLVTSIDGLDWYSAKEEGLGDLYEGLLQKNAEEKKSGAGQYFTPRPLIDCMVALMQPQPGELIQDPAAGTGGFLIAADRTIKQHTDGHFTLSESAQTFQIHQAFYGMELVPDAHRLLLMNLLLHGIESEVSAGGYPLAGGHAAAQGGSGADESRPLAPRRGAAARRGMTFTYPTSNKQLAFLQHIYRGLKPGGRAAVVLPDNVLFEAGQGQSIRADLMDKCNLHTILRLPTGIFYAQGVKTNVLFFQRGATEKGNTENVWVYDLRTNMPSFGKRTPLTFAHFAEFITCYGDEPNGTAPRSDQGEDRALALL
jgi:type I restriction enzyme M protein